jgi:hypothetical protein
LSLIDEGFIASLRAELRAERDMKMGLYSNIPDGTWLLVSASKGIIAQAKSSYLLPKSVPNYAELVLSEPGVFEFRLRKPSVLVSKVARSTYDADDGPHHLQVNILDTLNPASPAANSRGQNLILDTAATCTYLPTGVLSEARGSPNKYFSQFKPGGIVGLSSGQWVTRRNCYVQIDGKVILIHAAIGDTVLGLDVLGEVTFNWDPRRPDGVAEVFRF